MNTLPRWNFLDPSFDWLIVSGVGCPITAWPRALHTVYACCILYYAVVVDDVIFNRNTLLSLITRSV